MYPDKNNEDIVIDIDEGEKMEVEELEMIISNNIPNFHKLEKKPSYTNLEVYTETFEFDESSPCNEDNKLFKIDSINYNNKFKCREELEMFVNENIKYDGVYYKFDINKDKYNVQIVMRNRIRIIDVILQTHIKYC